VRVSEKEREGERERESAIFVSERIKERERERERIRERVCACARACALSQERWTENEEKYREEILDRVKEGWLEEEWASTMPQVTNNILQKNLTSISNPTETRTSHAIAGIQWIRMEELGKALTNRCRAVRELSNKRQEKQEGTRDRNTNSEQLESECQLKTPTRGRIHELLNLGASSSHNLFQSLITNQDMLRLREDMRPSHKTHRKGWWCRAFATAINRQCPTCNRLWNNLF